MSEEYGLKFVVNGEDYDKIKKSLNEQIEDLQQKVEQLEKENEKLKYLADDSKTMKAFIVEHNKVEQLEKENIRQKEVIENLTTMTVCGDKKQIKNTAQYKLEQLESIRKEAIKYIEKEIKDMPLNGCKLRLIDLLNILNKGE